MRLRINYKIFYLNGEFFLNILVHEIPVVQDEDQVDRGTY